MFHGPDAQRKVSKEGFLETTEEARKDEEAVLRRHVEVQKMIVNDGTIEEILQ